MSRKTTNYTGTDGRDQGKLFVITEMSSAQAESWAVRALLALMANNAEIPENFEELGMSGLAEMGLRALSNLRWEVLSPLLDEMMGCVQIVPDARKMHVVRPLIDEDIEEVSTRLALRREWWALHMGFLLAVAPSISGQPQPATAATHAQRVTKTSRR